jgi:sulfide dehydrogenase cytochrome subunit
MQGMIIHPEQKLGNCTLHKCAGSVIFLFFIMLAGNNAMATDVEKLVEKCAQCHGSAIANNNAPSLKGYPEIYFAFAVSQFQKRERPCVAMEYPSGEKKGSQTSMCELSQELSEDDIDQLAQYYSEQKPVRVLQAFDAGLAAQGAEIHSSSCEDCHGKEGGSPKNNAGLLGGQRMDYLREQIGYIRDGKRLSSKKMKHRLDRLTPNEIEALVNYFGSIR